MIYMFLYDTNLLKEIIKFDTHWPVDLSTHAYPMIKSGEGF